MGHRITALTAQKRNPQRVNVYLDGEFAFGLSRITVAWLEIGQEISDEKIALLQADDAREVAYQLALNYLSYRPRTTAELRKYLKKKEISAENIEGVMERLERSGLVNDTRFAEAWVENRSELRPRSRRALAYELRQRGVDRKAIDQSLEAVDDEEMAYQAAARQARKFESLEWQAFRLKMYGFLARRGFSYEVSATVAARVWAEIHEDQQGSAAPTRLEDPMNDTNEDNPSNQEVDL
jgi:regulatory protein